MTEAFVDVPVSIGIPDLKLVLPGVWGTIDLETDATIASTVRKLVSRLAGHADRAASLRADLRRQLTTLAEEARTGGAAELYFAIEAVPGLPVPLSLAVYWPPTDILGSLPTNPDTVIDSVIAALTSREGSNEFQDVARERFGDTATWRRTKTLMNPAEGEIPEHHTLLVDYWLAVPGTQRVLLLTFSTTLVEAKEQLLELFRTMVSVVEWAEPAAANS
jgi:hypothetical protein